MNLTPENNQETGGAPRDYTYFSSVEDAESNRRALNIHRGPDDVVMRAPKPEPPAKVDEYGTRARRAYRAHQADTDEPKGYNAMRRVPVYDSAAEEEARRARRVSPLGIRARDVATPYAPEKPEPPRNGGFNIRPDERMYDPPAYQPSSPPEVSAFAAPASPVMPSWYDETAARRQAHRPRPVVQRAQTVREDAQYDYTAPETPEKPERPPRERRAGRQPEAARSGAGVKLLAAAVIALTIAAVSLWLAGMSFDNQKNDILAARQSAQSAIVERHPLRYRELIEQKAAQYNIHPAFIAAIILNESSFDPMAQSRVGARGLMQLMEDTAEWINGKLELSGYSFDSMYDAEANVLFGCWYLNYLAGKFGGDPVLVASAFHAGQGTVSNWLSDSRYSVDQKTISLENMMDGPTKEYASRVMAAYAAYKRIFYETQTKGHANEKNALLCAYSDYPASALIFAGG